MGGPFNPNEARRGPFLRKDHCASFKTGLYQGPPSLAAAKEKGYEI